MNDIRGRYFFTAITIVAFSVGLLVAFSAVDNSLSEDDREYIPKYLSEVERLPELASFDDELKFITSIQRAVINIARKDEGLPYGQKREPKELYEAKKGLCFDRSRVIEKILRYSGFETRHVSIYSKQKTGSAFRSLLTPNVLSHAVTEVLTQEGWLVVDPNEQFITINNDRQPVSIKRIQIVAEAKHSIDWNNAPKTLIYEQPFTFVYGLYSRHGQFYPPYNFVPDINYGELISVWR